MKNGELLLRFGWVLCIVFLGALTNAQSRLQNKDEEFRSPFRYVIVSNAVDPKLNSKDEDRRFVDILMEEDAFSKANLTTLFELLNRRFPKPDLLYVNVFTNLQDVETPEEREQPKNSESKKGALHSNNAAFTRNEGKMFFYIYFTDGRSEEVKIR